MNAMIKTLEEIGQTTSLKQFDGTLQLLNSMNVSNNIITDLSEQVSEYVCALVPDDDDDEEEEEEAIVI